MRSLVLAADAQSGAGAGGSAYGSQATGRPDAAGRQGDPQWHAGDDPPFEEACGQRGGATYARHRATAQ
jgi:hypothetical protein